MSDKMTEDEAMKRYNLIVKFAAVVAILMASYQTWSFFVSSRYQALCGGSYWDLSNKQVDSCEAMKTELDQKK